MNFYCTTEHCSCMGIKQFSAGKSIRCTAESCENKSEPSCGSCKWYAGGRVRERPVRTRCRLRVG
nr:MAG TPA: hypothetical protein [Caudoviricetes sp.]